MQNRKRDTDVQNRFFDPGKWQGWDVLREQHWNMYIIFGETDHQPRLGAWDKCSGLVHWEDPEGSGRLGWGIHVNPWLIHVNVWQKPLKYCKVISLQLIKINEKKKRKKAETSEEIMSMNGHWGQNMHFTAAMSSLISTALDSL